MAEKQLITLLTISPLREKIDGGTSVFCFETFLQYVYMVFEAPRKDKNVFDKEIDSWKSEVNMEKNSIDYQFSIFSHYLKYPNDKRTIVELEKKHIEMMNLDEMYDIFRERFSNGSDFIFYFVGNIDMEEHIPLIEKYIGGISSTEKKEEWIDRSQEFAKGVVDKTLCVGIGKKSQVDITTEMPFDRNDKDELCITILNHIVDIKLTENIREKLSGTYGVFFRLRVLKEPKSMVSMNIFFGCEPKRTDELTHAIWNVLDEIIKNGPTETDLDKAKTQLCSRREVAVRENNSWIRWFEQLYDYDNKLLTLDEYKEQINALTVEDIKKVAKYLQHDEYVRAVLLPKRMKKKNDRMKN
jgi:zinc protease